MDELDIMGYNYIDRLYQTNTYVPEHARFPNRLMLGTETGNEIHYWLGVRNNDYVIGEFIWTGIDYLGESGTFPCRGNGSGFFDFAGTRKAEYYQRAAYWRDDPVLQLSVTGARFPPPACAAATAGRGAAADRPGRSQRPAQINWKLPANAPATVRAVTNCDEVELFLNDKSLGRHAVSHDVYNSDWTVPYAAGKLSAVGYRAGKQVATNELSHQRHGGAGFRSRHNSRPLSAIWRSTRLPSLTRPA